MPVLENTLTSLSLLRSHQVCMGGTETTNGEGLSTQEVVMATIFHVTYSMNI